MKSFIIILFISCTLSGFSQMKHPDGAYKEFWKDDLLKKEGFYRNNNKVGGWKDYFENGQLQKTYSYYNDGLPTGIEEAYSVNGNLVRETKRNQDGDLITKHYFDNGKLSTIYALMPSNDKKYFIKAGGYKEFYENDSLKIESTYFNNELNGVWTQKHETGEKEWEVVYVDGYKQGSYKHFYKNGQLKLEGLNKLDFKNGEEKQYDSIGNLISILTYKQGKLKKVNAEINLMQTEIPEGVIEHVPVYPGCEIFPGNIQKRDCMGKMISTFVSKNFDTNLATSLNLNGVQKISVIFKIDKTGNVIDVKACAPHPNLEKEAINVIKKLPIIKPGMQRGKAVIVPYSLPIVFQIESKPK